MNSGGPGRDCPLSYRYGAAALVRGAALEVDTVWVAGGLYGNPFALERLLELYERERGSKALVFNGDFHWFDIDPRWHARINEAVLAQHATRGNVETEVANPGEDAGCGCAYPEWVDDDTVARSNAILRRLSQTARDFPIVLQQLARLPMHLVVLVGPERVGIVHGDAESLAGWGFSQEALATSRGQHAAERAFGEARIRVFASSHSCLPVLHGFAGSRCIINNGAAGMPNFRGTRFGIATRISVSPYRRALYGQRAGALPVEAVALEYDAPGWERCFLEQWPRGSDAYRSYFERIVGGPRYAPAQALREAPARAA
jgi:hypothetical protein